MRNLAPYIALSVIIYFGCSNKINNQNFQAATLHEKIPLKIGNKLKNERYFGIKHIYTDSLNYISYVLDNKKLSFQCIEQHDKDFIIDFPDTLLFNEIYDVFISDSLVFVLNDRRKDYQFDNPVLLMYLRREKNNWDLIKSWDLSTLLNWEFYYIRWQTTGTFLIKDNNLYLAYGIRNENQNFLDIYSYLQINLAENTPKSFSKILSYPKQFIKRKQNNNDTYLRVFNDSIFLYGFKSMDSLFLVNREGDKLSIKKFSHKNNYQEFEKEKKTDLGYLRWYESTNEAIVNEIINNYGIIIIKRRKRDEINSKIIFDFYYFDHKLNLKSVVFCEDPISNMFYPYKNGIITFNKTYDTLYHYSIQ
jgi:hypothetical protein